MITIIFLVLAGCSMLPLVLSSLGIIKRKKLGLYVNIISLIAICVVMLSVSTFAAVNDNETAEAASSSVSLGAGIGMLGAALVTGASCIGAGVAVSSAASAAIGALSEDSKTFGKALIFVALAEGIGIYGVLISIQILGKL